MKKNTNPIPQNIRFAALAADAVCFRVVNSVLEVLLGEVTSVNNVYKGKLAYIGGLINVDETADEAVTRLLQDKAGIKKIYKEQLYTFSKVDRDPRGRVVAVAYIALTGDTNAQDLIKAKTFTVWRAVSDLPKLAYDHDEITKVAVERQIKNCIYRYCKTLMPEFLFLIYKKYTKQY
jgi:8-oxo-dGTP diphosphatase